MKNKIYKDDSTSTSQFQDFNAPSYFTRKSSLDRTKINMSLEDSKYESPRPKKRLESLKQNSYA